MLRKLMKYEISAMGRILLPLYGALLFMSLLMGIIANGLVALPIFAGIVIFLYTAVAITAAVMTIILIVQRFYKNLLGNEGYLMFALPVTAGKHIWSKGITAGLWSVIASIVGFLSALVILVSTENSGLVQMMEGIRIVWKEVGAMSLVYLVEIVVLLFLGAGVMIFRIYAAIAIGHLWGNHRILGGILAYLGLGVAEAAIISAVEKISIVLDMVDKFREIFEAIGEKAFSQLTFLGMALTFALFIGVYYVVTRYILKNKLNLE